MDMEKHTDKNPQGRGKDSNVASASDKEPMQGMEMHSHDMSGPGMQDGMAHADQMGHMGNLKVKFWVCLIVSIPILLLSPMMGMHLPFQFSFAGSDWVVLALATFLFFYGGKPFFDGALRELKNRKPAMMTLISMGISVSYFYSLFAFVWNRLDRTYSVRMNFFWELATLIVIMLLGHWIEMRAVGDAGDALKKMAELLPSTAHLVNENGNTVDVAVSTLKIGDVVTVRAGEKIPADGTVASGDSTVNESMVTGEAKAVVVSNGDKVIGGSINGNGTISVRVTGTGESGYLAQVMKLVGDARKEKSEAENLSDKVARALFYIALGAGIAAFVVWFLITRDIDMALERLVTVLIIACPHALGLAIPLVVARSTSLAASHGLLIRNRHAVEEAKAIRVAAMDKTGTLTEGNFAVRTVKSLDSDWSDDRVLETMAALERESSHPLAAGILESARSRNLTVPLASNVKTMGGTGLSGVVDGRKVEIVTAAYLDSKRLPYSENEFSELSRQGNSISYLLADEKVVGLVAEGDEIKPEARKTVEALRSRGIEPVMLTGDNEGFAKAVAEQVGITEFHAGLLPQDKEKVIESYRRENRPVMMVGDGVNDAPALAKANIGVAIGAGTDVAIDSADVILVKSNPYDIVHFLNLAKNTSEKIVQNLWWGAGYNIVAIPLAAGILAPVGIVLSPAVGAIFMSASTVIVAINAMRLKME
ncbi:copper-translocating P-type ATPase [Oxalobacter formigenes HOxBLS]|uniref:Copper-translocating P-type ATPase n=3 Tax=Oxalobacter paraformigenes TaxID=556268 RepID=C3X2E2_9BURK|nr:copper-translocating P-type ATPase [Oxalobacter paraformigenes]